MTNYRSATLFFVIVTMGAFSFRSMGQAVGVPQSITIFFPDFFYKTTMPKGDTTFVYEYLNRSKKTVSIYDITDADQVSFIKYYKVFRTEMPRPNSNISAPSQYNMLYEYAHPSKDMWVRYDRSVGETVRYKSYKDKIIGTDSVLITDPAKGQLKFIYKYYKTEITERSTTVEEHDHTH